MAITVESPQKKHRWIFPLTLMGVITFISGTAGPDLGPMTFAGIDKLGHFCVFGALSVGFARCFERLGKNAGLRQWFWAVLLTVGFGMGDELHQFTNPLRSFEWNDLLADATGAIVFAGLYCFIKSLRNVLEKRIL